MIFLCVCVASAQTPEKRQADPFSGYWFLHLQGGMGYTIGETTEFSRLVSPSVAVSAGYQFTPVWALRAGMSGWEGKGAISDKRTYSYAFNFLQGNVDVVVDLCNIARYRRSRTVNPYIFAGVGFEGGINNDQALSFPADCFPGSYRWTEKSGTRFSFVGRAGVGVDFRIVDAVRFTIEVNANAYDDHFNSKKETFFDWQINALAGLKFNFGMKKAREKAEAKNACCAAVPAEPQIVEKVVEKVVEKEVVKEVAPEFTGASRDIFFTINKYDLSEYEIIKIGEIVQILKANPTATVTVTGYADAETGTAKRNLYLSEKRAEAVAAKLYEAGIEKDRVAVDYKGSESVPYNTPEKNRVAICIVK